MADIVDSRKSQQKQLMSDFKELANLITRKNRKKFASPITITLGDEFQSVLFKLSDSLNIIFQLEENLIHLYKGFKLRYVLVEGKIETEINKKIAYGMMGEGLTTAREILNKLKTDKSRFYIELRNKEKANVINSGFKIYQDYVDDWKFDKDYETISKFLVQPDYKVVADSLGKTRSQIWKRRKSLRIEEYYAIKKVITYLGGDL